MNLYIIGFFLILLIIIILSKYNSFIKSLNKVKEAESGIDIYLSQKFDLIPNLVECVKGYSKYEKSTLEEITSLRNNYVSNAKESMKNAEAINNNMNKIMAVAENYPELKASEQFLNLQKQLVQIESKLQAARRIYNYEVTSYNTYIETIPNNLIALIFRFKKEELFEIEDFKRENININF